MTEGEDGMSDNMRRYDVLGRREATKTGVYKDVPVGQLRMRMER